VGGQAASAWVQTYDEKPKRRLYELLRSQGMQDNQQVVFLTDGGEDIRDIPRYLNPRQSITWGVSKNRPAYRHMYVCLCRSLRRLPDWLRVE
jgi:hypothetical protein